MLGMAYQWENSLTTTNSACRRPVSKDLVRKPSFPVTLTEGESLALLRKSAVESTGSAVLRKPGSQWPRGLPVYHSVCMRIVVVRQLFSDRWGLSSFKTMSVKR